MLYPLSYEGRTGAKRGRQPLAMPCRYFGPIVGGGCERVPSPWRPGSSSWLEWGRAEAASPVPKAACARRRGGRVGPERAGRGGAGPGCSR